MSRGTGPVLPVKDASTTVKAMLWAQCGYCQAGFEVELLGCWAGLSCSSTEAKQTAPRWEVTQQRRHNPPCEALFENVQRDPQALSCFGPAWSSLGALVHLASLEVPCPTSPPGEMPAPALSVSWSGISDTAPTSKKELLMFSCFAEGFNHLNLRDKVMLHYWSK